MLLERGREGGRTEREREREREGGIDAREKHQLVTFSYTPQLGIKPTT